jgi:hypothetical protein
VPQRVLPTIQKQAATHQKNHAWQTGLRQVCESRRNASGADLRFAIGRGYL